MMKTPYWLSDYIEFAREVPAGYLVLIMYIRSARNKARIVAIIEATSLLSKWAPIPLLGGPFSEKKGVFWVAIPAKHLGSISKKVVRFGYVNRVDLLIPAGDDVKVPTDVDVFRWKKQRYYTRSLFKEDAKQLRNRAPDKRYFLLEKGSGEVETIRGYRGGGGPFDRRSFPVYDARLLVNIAGQGRHNKLLDPFAGVGGVIIEAASSGHVVFSADNDKALRLGLYQLSSRHVYSDTTKLPFSSNSMDSIASELPFHPLFNKNLRKVFTEMIRVVKENGRLVFFCVPPQLPVIEEEAIKLNLEIFLRETVNRKGLDVVVLGYKKGGGEI